MKKLIIPVLFLSLLSVSCGSKKEAQKEEATKVETVETVEAVATVETAVIAETVDSMATEACEGDSTMVEVKDSTEVVVEE